jgi:hypothetical protein
MPWLQRFLLEKLLQYLKKKCYRTGQREKFNFILTLQSLTTHIFPQRTIAFQTPYMRRYMRKPCDMSTRAFAERGAEINAYLMEFPPFDVNQELDDVEIMDILENVVPNTWSKIMVLQVFDPMEHTASDFFAFCERHEFTMGLLDHSNDLKNEVKFCVDSSAEAPNNKKCPPLKSGVTDIKQMAMELQSGWWYNP